LATVAVAHLAKQRSAVDGILECDSPQEHHRSPRRSILLLSRPRPLAAARASG
jgi:hypothetical protein